MAPKSTALITVPVSRATAAMSKASASRLCACTMPSNALSARRPSPSCIFSATVKLRLVEVRMWVRAGVVMPLPTWRTVSRSSDETSRSSAPGTGFRLNTGRLPASSRSGTGKTST